ncbi:MAG: 23S rRNA (adenine(2503)-C(2))-methyltransferase RlmN, partial [Chlamydiia bacterium]|nr:23S rRNA (adenine(2503)-C(2))-methyltransferase RlmN [Chlamydiia bacterium]
MLFAVMEKNRVSPFGFTLQDMELWMESQGEKRFRATQFFEWLYRKKVFSFDQMTNFSKEFREKLNRSFGESLVLQKVVRSEEGETEKFLWGLVDGKRVESVLICSGDRRTVCVSSQVGCPARCAFCASGKEGLLRNLSTAEIVEQVLQIDRLLLEKGERVCHVVFMGMG